MNLLYIVDRFPVVTETFVLQEIEWLVRAGEKVRVCSRRRPDPREPVHEEVACILGDTLHLPSGPAGVLARALSALAVLAFEPRRAPGALLWAIRARAYERGTLRVFAEAAYLRRRLPRDVEHVHAHFAHNSTSLALLVSRLAAVPFSFTTHGTDLLDATHPRLLARKVAEARFAATVSDFTREHLARLVAPEDLRKIVVIRNGIDPERFPPRSHEPTGRIPAILTVARLIEKKGIDVLIDACRLLEARGVDLRWKVIGEGPLRPSLERQAAAAGQLGRLTLVGAQTQSSVRAAYREAAAFVLPSRQEALPVAICEALAVGVPVIATAVGGVSEVVRDGESGLLVPPNDPGALANAVERLLADTELRARLSDGGRRIVAGYDPSPWVDALRDLFSEAEAL